VGATVNAAGHTTQNQQAARGEVARQHLGHARPIGRRMAGADDGDGGPAEQFCIAAHPEDRRRVVDFAQALGIFHARIAHQRGAERRYARPLLFGSAARLAVEDELRGFGGKTQSLEIGERETEDLADGVEFLHRVENALWAETGREREAKPGEAILIERRGAGRGGFLGLRSHAGP
jgi:hypothetical protein